MLKRAQRLYIMLKLLRVLSNWHEVWKNYFGGQTLPPLKLRRGLTLYHTAADGPVLLVLEVFANRYYRRHLSFPKGGNVVDIGANIGAFTLDYASAGEAIHVHAYEPNPQTSETLRRNVESNQLGVRVTTYAEAVGGECGELKLWTNVPSLIATGYGDEPPSPGGRRVTVPMIDLNEVVRRVGGPIELLKIDTEGAEVDILEGASRPTLQTIRQVVLEYHDAIRPNALESCRRVLEAARFNCLTVPDRRKGGREGLLYAWRG